jgi:hypothetical protein
MAWSPIPSNVCKVLKTKDLLPDFPVQACGLNEKAPGMPGLFFYLV